MLQSFVAGGTGWSDISLFYSEEDQNRPKLCVSRRKHQSGKMAVNSPQIKRVRQTSDGSCISSHGTDLDQESTPLLQGSLNQSYSSAHPNMTRSTAGRSRASTIIGSLVASVRKLQKSVGCLQGFNLLVGIIVGSGIFIAPTIVVHQVHDFGVSLLIWVVGGCIILMGALCYCELGVMIQKAGGNYAMMTFAYGKVAGFLTCWTFAFVVDPTVIAAVALTLGTYAMKPFHQFIIPTNQTSVSLLYQADHTTISPPITQNPDSGKEQLYEKAVAAAAILLVGITNALSIKAATLLQRLFTFCQMGAVVFVVALGIWQLAHGQVQYLGTVFTEVNLSWSLVGELGIALYGALWAYNGWQQVCNVTEEMHEVEKNLFRSVMSACPVVMVCYICVNIALMTTLSPQQLGASPAVGVDFVSDVIGTKAGYIMPILVALSCYGSVNGYVFTCCRVTLAAGREGHMPKIFGMIHRRRLTPIPSIILSTTIALLMLVPDASNIQMLITFASVAGWTIYGASVFAVIVLRFTKPDVHRPYKVWILTAVIMSFVSIFLIVVPFLSQPYVCATALGFILLGLPVYYLLIYLEPKHPTWFAKGKKQFYSFSEKKMGLAVCSM